jgi:hypothetical protein
MKTYDALVDAIAADISDYFDEGNGGKVIVTHFVVLANYIDADGDQNIYSNTALDQRCSESLGLLMFGLAREQARAARSLLDEDEDT